MLLTSNHPMFVFWGPEHTCFYNDAYARSIGPEKDPAALGAPGRVVWDEIWDIIGPQIELVMAAEGATWHENHLVPITRHGKREDVYWTYGYGPIDEPTAANGVGGVLVLCTETTALVKAEQTRALEAEEVRNRILELNHRVKNNIATINAMVNIEAAKISEPTTREALGRISGRLQSFSKTDRLGGDDVA